MDDLTICYHGSMQKTAIMSNYHVECAIHMYMNSLRKKDRFFWSLYKSLWGCNVNEWREAVSREGYRGRAIEGGLSEEAVWRSMLQWVSISRYNRDSSVAWHHQHSLPPGRRTGRPCGRWRETARTAVWPMHINMLCSCSMNNGVELGMLIWHSF
jgi:hypothetical protein